MGHFYMVQLLHVDLRPMKKTTIFFLLMCVESTILIYNMIFLEGPN